MKTLKFPLYGGAWYSATFSDDGKAVGFDVSRVTVRELAHGLAWVNRFSGAPDRGYSVGEHSLLLADWVRRAKDEPWSDRALNRTRACLIHDAAEALGCADANGKLKKLIAQPVRDYEAALTKDLWRHLHPGVHEVSWDTIWPSLHRYDQALGDWEAAFFGFPHDIAYFQRDDARTEPLPGFPRCLAAPVVEHVWLRAWAGEDVW